MTIEQSREFLKNNPLLTHYLIAFTVSGDTANQRYPIKDKKERDLVDVLLLGDLLKTLEEKGIITICLKAQNQP